MAVKVGDFYAIQKRQRARTAALLPVLALFYFAGISLLALGFAATLNLVLAGSMLRPESLGWFLLAAAAAAVAVAVFHYHDARASGAAFILRRLQARPPDPDDVIHVRFVNTLEEMRIAAGLPRVRGFVLPGAAVNSLAVIEADGTPAVAVTEGLLAEFGRDEVAAVAAHELAHVASGDTVYVTLVCSLANFFEKIREALEPERVEPAERGRGRGGASPLPVFLYLAAACSGIVMHLLSVLVSRQRELLADAAAVEINRDPQSLARALHGAHVRNAFVGDFSRTYSPLFIVPPDGNDVAEGFFARLMTTHPPFSRRFEALAAMAHKTAAELVEETERRTAARSEARTVLISAEEAAARREPGRGAETESLAGAAAEGEPRVWALQAGEGDWIGPFTLRELLLHPAFTTMVVVRNMQEVAAAKAREFPAVRAALRRSPRCGAADPRVLGRCPRCRTALARTYYEGVAVLSCRGCRGRLVAMDTMDRIIARRQVAFSEDLCAKARAFRERVVLNPLKKLKPAAGPPGAPCPACGEAMVQRPYNYQYFVLVDKCLACSRIWFDADELEILQILIER